MLGYVTSTVQFEEIQRSCDNHVIFILAGREWNLDFDFEHELSESSYFDNAM